MSQTITRPFEFDSAHRVMNQKFKCYNLHGHRYRAELTFFFVEVEEIGYQIDFSEIKRIGGQWIDDHLDHAIILNPEDKSILKVCDELSSRFWTMSLNGERYCNPTVENVSKEVFLAISTLFDHESKLILTEVKLFETPNCWTICTRKSITTEEEENFFVKNYVSLKDYQKKKGQIQYDDRF